MLTFTCIQVLKRSFYGIGCFILWTELLMPIGALEIVLHELNCMSAVVLMFYENLKIKDMISARCQ